MSLNKAMLIGRLGKDPETRFTGTGIPVSTFSIATDETWKDRSGQKQKKTEWHRCVAWSKLAEIVQQWVKKGQLVYVEGRIQTRKWTDRENVTRYSTEIVVQTLRMLGSKQNGAPAEAEAEGAGDHDAPAPAENTSGFSGGGSEITDEDIPF